MAKTIAICNQKGGVGKTTTTLNLGVGLARQGKRVLLCDADPQSDLTAALGWNGDTLEKSLGRLMYLATQEYKPIVQDTIIHHPEGVDLIPSNLDLSSMESQLVNAMSREKILSNLLKTVKKDYDYRSIMILMRHMIRVMPLSKELSSLYTTSLLRLSW